MGVTRLPTRLPFFINMYTHLYNFNINSYNKIKNCIESCETFEQFESCTNMVNNFIYYSNVSYEGMKYRLKSIHFIKRYKELIAYKEVTHAIIDELKELIDAWMNQYNAAIEESAREELPIPKYKDFKVKGFVYKKKRKNGKKKMDTNISN